MADYQLILPDGWKRKVVYIELLYSPIKTSSYTTVSVAVLARCFFGGTEHLLLLLKESGVLDCDVIDRLDSPQQAQATCLHTSHSRHNS